ncbi:hypothetical protein INR49_008389, partial [Caranx melampygus]
KIKLVRQSALTERALRPKTTTASPPVGPERAACSSADRVIPSCPCCSQQLNLPSVSLRSFHNMDEREVGVQHKTCSPQTSTGKSVARTTWTVIKGEGPVRAGLELRALCSSEGLHSEPGGRAQIRIVSSLLVDISS